MSQEFEIWMSLWGIVMEGMFRKCWEEINLNFFGVNSFRAAVRSKIGFYSGLTIYLNYGK